MAAVLRLSEQEQKALVAEFSIVSALLRLESSTCFDRFLRDSETCKGVLCWTGTMGRQLSIGKMQDAMKNHEDTR